jgi:hypothetical protein
VRRWLSPTRRSNTEQDDGQPAAPLTISGGVLRASPVLSFLAVLIFAAASDAAESFGAVFAVGGMAAAAALLVGALVGFLFGLPKTLSAADDGNALMQQNTNLDEISDWLTKILVGLGLVQIGQISDRFGDVADSVASGMGGGNAGHSFALSLLLYSLVDGFMLAYLWTRVEVTIGLNATARYLEARADTLARPLPVEPPELPSPPPALSDDEAA